MGDDTTIIGRAAPVLMDDDGTLVPVGSGSDTPVTALAPLCADGPTPAVLPEPWVLTRRQRVTLMIAVVLALATGVVAVALAVSLAA